MEGREVFFPFGGHQEKWKGEAVPETNDYPALRHARGFIHAFPWPSGITGGEMQNRHVERFVLKGEIVVMVCRNSDGVFPLAGEGITHLGGCSCYGYVKGRLGEYRQKIATRTVDLKQGKALSRPSFKTVP